MTLSDALIEDFRSQGQGAAFAGSPLRFYLQGSRGVIMRDSLHERTGRLVGSPINLGLTIKTLTSDDWFFDGPRVGSPTLATIFGLDLCKSAEPKLSDLLPGEATPPRIKLSDLLVA